MLAVLGLSLAAAGVFHARRSSRTGAAGPAPAPLNVLLVTLDTARADRFGCYGYAAAKTRYIDRLAAEGVRFENAHSSVPITLPAHASLFTGLYPTRHGVRNNGNFYLPERLPTLAGVFKSRGYDTGAFVSAFVLDKRYGLARGFDVYDDRMEGASTQVVSLEAERRGDRTALALGRWLEGRTPQRPFFAWLHLYDPHEPYRPPPPFRQLFAAAPYDGELAFDDAVLASSLDKLRALGLLERTLVAVTADHGESLGEHGEETHSMFLYEGALRVPLVLWRPGLLPAGRVVGEPVRLTDVGPTLLELAGPAPAGETGLDARDGRSLRTLALGQPSTGPAPPLYAETYLPQLYMDWAPLRALRDARFKFIDAPRPELYDLADDPREERNLYGQDPRRAEALRAALERESGGPGVQSTGALDRDTAEKLAALGYLGAGGGASRPPSERRDPKDGIQIFNRLRRANSAVRERRFDEALPALRQVLAEDPRNAFARLVMGSAHMGLERWREALPWFRSYLELVPSSSYAHHWLAICHLRLGERDQALREAAAALAIDPRFSDARVLRGGVLAALGRHAEAVVELRQAVETDPDKPVLRLDLAKVLAEGGRAAEARAEYETLLGRQSEFAPALVGLAALEGGLGRTAQAEELLRRALRADAGSLEARYNLARLLSRTGRAAEAQAEWRVLHDAPRTPAGWRREAQAALRARPQ